MSSDIVLTAALRNNLLSLQNTQNIIDQTQLRLATGLKVNSALDGPSSFFAAQSLDNRASDLSGLLDGISQSIRTIEEADNGITALVSLVEQTQSITTAARDELSASEGEARAIGNVDLRSVTDITSFSFIDDGDVFDIATTDADGNLISEEITISAGDSAYSLTAQITNKFLDSYAGEIIAKITNEGFISIQSSNGQSFRIIDGVVGDGDEVRDLGFNALGLGDYVENEFIFNGGFRSRAEATIVAGNAVLSIPLYEGSGNIAEAGDLIANSSYQDADGNTILSNIATGNLFIRLHTDNGTTGYISFNLSATASFQDLVDSINFNSNLNEYIEAGFDSNTGQFSITSISDGLKSFTFGPLTNGANPLIFDLGLGDPFGVLDPNITSGFGFDIKFQHFSFSESTESLDELVFEYNNVREQIDALVNDTQFRGINLLKGDDLTTSFNEDNSSKLTTNGSNFTANGLGITKATFRNFQDIETSQIQSDNALSKVRNFGVSLANNLAIIKIRQDFTKNTIDILKAGADDLTIADQNEEGANLLSLQTRQALGVTSLSLASQSQQAVLRLF